MNSFKIKSYAKINLALNVTGKKKKFTQNRNFDFFYRFARFNLFKTDR